MRTDEDIENKKYPVKKQKKPLVLRDAVDPPRAKPVEWASLLDEVKALMPEYPDQTAGDRAYRAAREKRMVNPPAPTVANRFVRSLGENAPEAARSGVSSSLIADAHERAKQQAQGPVNSLAARRINQPPLVSKAAQNPAPPIAEPGYFNALGEVARDPSRLLPGSPGWAEGAGAYVPTMAAMTLDPGGAALGGAAFKVAGAAGKGAARLAGDFGRRLGEVPLPAGVMRAAHQLVNDESGQAIPNWAGLAAKGALDAADDAFEAGGQVVGGAARRAGTLGMAGLTAGADAIAPSAKKFGDLLHVPKAKAEAIATAIANKMDLPGRTGKTADEWYETVKNERAATSSPLANSVLDGVRRQFVSDFGMTPEQKAIREVGRVAGNDIARPAEELAVRLGKDRTDAEQVDIYKYATGMSQPSGPFNALAWQDGNAVRSVSREMDRKLEDLGALPQGMTDIYDGTHLPRGYAKHWQAENQLQNLADDPIKKIKEGFTDNRVLGSYRRGLDETMSENDFLAKQASAAQTGENWRQVSRNQDGSINAHRDWTEAERAKWGEVLHASSGLQRKATKARREGEAAAVLAEYAKPGAGDKHGIFAEPLPAFTAGAPASAVHPETKVIKNAQGIDQRYTLLDAKKARDLNVHRYGNLANHYVRDDVLFYLRNENELKPFIDKVNKYTMNNLWKKMVTIGNFPGYFANNFFQNPLILERTGGSMMDMPGAWVDLANNSVDVQRMVDAGVIRNGVLARELGSQLQHFNKTLSSQHTPSGFSVSKQIFRAMNALKSYEQDAYTLAGASDDLYRVAMVKGLMSREGKSFDEAAEIAKTAFYDSQMVNAPAAQVASTIAPFAKVLWWAANNEAKAWTQNPGKAAYVNALVAGLPVAAGVAMGRGLTQQDAEKLSLRKNMQGFGNNFPVPYKDAKGSNYYWDTSNYNHYNQFAPPENTALSLPIPGTDSRIGIPRGLMPGGVPAAIGQLAWNHDAFTGKPINTYARTDGSTTEDNTLNFVARSMSPGSGRNALALYDAMVGSKDTGADRTAKIGRYLTGIKIQPANIEEGKKWNVKDRKIDESNYSRLIKEAENEGDLDTAAELTIKKARIIEKAQDKYRRMEKGQR